MRFHRYFFALAPCVLLANSASAAFLINEVDADTPGSDAAEFVELKGNANESVVGLTVVFYNGTGTAGGPPRAKAAFDLTGTADANGYYVIGDTGVAGVSLVIPNGTIENGEDAIAVYSGTSAAAITATNMAGATSPATAPGVLVDHVIWESGSDNTPDWTPFTMTAVDEAGGGASPLHSIGREPDGTGTFVLGNPTPNAANQALADKEVNVPSSVSFGLSNGSTVSTRTVTIRNSGLGTMTVNSFGLDAESDAEFSIVSGPDPALPAALAQNEATAIVLQFSNSDLSVSRVFAGAINYTTDDPTSGSGSIAVSAEFVKVLQTASPGDVVVNEFCYNPNAGAANGGAQDYNGDGTASTTQDEFVEIYNTTASSINIQGWEVNAQSGPGGSFTLFPYIFPAGTILPANGVVVVFNAGTPTGFASGVAFTDGPALANGGATIEVTDGTTRLDGLAYNDAMGTAGFTDVNLTAIGGSLGRSPDGSSSIVEFAHDSSVVEMRPSPGQSNGYVTAAQDWQMFE